MPTAAAAPAPSSRVRTKRRRASSQIKDLIVGADIAGASREREDYLKKQAEAQFAVKESELVEAVDKLLKRHKLA